MTIRCLIVDDSAVVRRAAKELLEREGIDVVGTAATGKQATGLIRALGPDVVLVDIDLGGESGLNLVRQLGISSEAAGCTIILMSSYDAVDFAGLIRDSQAIGFVPKPELSERAIRTLLDQAPGETSSEPGGT